MTKNLHILLIYVVLALATIIAFEPMRHNQFINYDDNKYVTENPNIKGGITRESVFWAFTTPHFNMWHPLTSLSHMLDCQLFGLNPFWHHLTSLLFHLASTLLLFGILKRMTGAVWRSAFVAALFALHPLNVESVAWVAERKNVLCGFFWMLTIAAYIRYAEHPGIGRYLGVVLVFSLALMAKPMVVTLPFVLLLLDYWPLDRFQWSRLQSKSVKADYQKSSVWRLLGEKIPLFILSAVLSVITYIAQQSGGVVKPWERFPLNIRVSNALVSYISYIVKMVYPSRLAVLYPHPGSSLPAWQPIVCFMIIAVISIGIIYTARRRRYLAVGWLWYLGTMVPVIGLVQVGVQAMADRYAYLPLIGIFIIVAWGAAELLAKWRYQRIGYGITAGVVLAGMLICTRMQVRYWQNNFTLYEHTLAVTEDNYIIGYNYGCALYYYGNSLLEKGQSDQAEIYFNVAAKNWKWVLGFKPNRLQVHINLGVAMARQRRYDEAIKYFNEALRIKPDSSAVYYNLGSVYAWQGKYELAIQNYNEALRIERNYPNAHHRLGDALAHQGKLGEAIQHYTEALRLKPDWVEVMNKLARILATHKGAGLRQPDEAVRLAERACQLTNHENPGFLDTLAVAYAAADSFSDAVATAEKALELASSSGQKELTEQIQSRLHLYKAARPYVEPLPEASSD